MRTQTLAPNPSKAPLFPIHVSDSRGEKFVCADPRATRALVAIMDLCAVLGGAASHWGGPAAFAEIQSAIWGWVFHLAQRQKKNWHELFHLINDAGHCENGIYALKAIWGFAGLSLEDLLEFRSIQSPLSGHGEVHLFPQGVELSNGPLGSAVGQAQGLAMADRLLGNQRITILTLSDGGAMEGEAREVLASLPGLAARGLVNPFLLVVSDNNTKLSGRIDSDSFSMAPSFESLSSLGWKHLVVEEGHDLSRLVEVVGSSLHELSQASARPIVLQVKTIKGFGVQSTVQSPSGGHGFPLKKKEEISAFVTEIYGGHPIPGPIQELIKKLMDRETIKTPLKFSRLDSQSEDKIQLGVSRAMIRARQENIPIISLSSDLPGSTGVAGFRKAYPRESFDFGVAEANMISAAAGFSRAGLVPVVDTFAQFGVTKGALPFTMAALSMAPIVAVFSHTGFQDAADGASHQALGYVAMMSSIPHVQLYSLSCAEEAESLIYQALRCFHETRASGRVPDSYVFFLGRENFPIRYTEAMTYELGKAHIFWDTSKKFSKSVCLVASGSLVREALEAAQELEARGFGSVVLHPSSIKPLDLETIKKSITSCSGRIVIVEDHQKIGGLAQILLASLSLESFQVSARSLGVEQSFGQSAYEALHLYQKHGMDRESILASALDLLS